MQPGREIEKLVKLKLKAEKGAFRLDGRSAIFSASLQTISKYAIVASIHKAICQPDSGIWQRRRNGKILNRKIKNKEEEWIDGTKTGNPGSQLRDKLQ